MLPTELRPEDLGKFQELIEANFTGRDELYAAARSMDDEARQQVCRRLAEHLAGHAAELQQIVAASGSDPAEPLDVEPIAEALFELAKMNHGERGVIDSAIEGERNLRKEYDRAIEDTSNPEATNTLHRQRDDVEFGEQILRGMERPVDRPDE
jgi:uncharacterized protein (TIGR02284 family)